MVPVEQASVAAGLTDFDPRGSTALAKNLQDAQRRNSACVLDFSDEAISGTSNPSAIRLSIPSVMIASNLLMGRFKDVPINLRIPDSKGLNLQLARGGFFFALANRFQINWFGEEPGDWNKTAKDWALPFHPSDAKMRRAALVDVKDPSSDSWVVRAAFQRYLLSVMHPHNRPPDRLRHDLRQIAGRWLSSRLAIEPGSEMVATLGDCLEVFYQLVVNVPDHASLRSSTSGCSLGQVYATLGGGRESHNRIHFTVLDNGAGLPKRVRQLFRDRERSAEEALRDAVMGRLPRPLGGRGVGLHLVRRIASQYTEGLRNIGGKSSIRIITSGDTDGSATCLEWNPDSGEPDAYSIEGLPIQGTLVWVSLGLENRFAEESSHQLELTFAEPLAG